ncbi:hypothetical protein [Vagococcus carniphilus]|uniref:hypothetical protein n=1 Tax=Vagococcus carniphilus TaxID=218144 RepID=UPI002892599C|nr:hypothetical protein [Vagococcus carniphilus]MDT2865286.1 hypothetical protein [Vagococcus carniphilus]
MKNDIIGISLGLEDMKFKNIDLKDFDSNFSLFDYDIVLLDLNRVIDNYNQTSKYNGKPRLTNNESFRFISDFERIQTEIKDLLAIGKTIYVNLPEIPIISIFSGNKKYSGTGKNRQATNLVKDLNLLDILPIKIKTTTSLGSRQDYDRNSVYKELYRIKKMNYLYYVYFETEEQGQVISTILETEKKISQIFTIGEGQLIILPFNFKPEFYSSTAEYRKIINDFLHVIDDLREESKIGISEYSLPEWSKKYNILDEKVKATKINKIEKQLTNLKSEKETIKNELLELQKYKLIFTSTGKELEEIIYKILLELGFKNKPVEYNRADGIFDFKGTDIVTEIKGVKGSSAERHGAQLEKWVSEFFEQEGKQAKGLLIVNGFREKDLKLRTELIFPDQMINYSIKREHCLISTVQLLGIYIECKKNPDKSNELIFELINTVGVYDKFLDYREFL